MVLSINGQIHIVYETVDFDLGHLVICRGEFIPYFCTGFLALRATSRTFKLLDIWNHMEIENDWSNQQTFQLAVYESDANGRALPLRYFPNGKIFFESLSPEMRQDVVIIHNNFIIGKVNKIQRFKYFGFWYQDVAERSDICPAKRNGIFATFLEDKQDEKHVDDSLAWKLLVLSANDMFGEDRLFNMFHADWFRSDVFEYYIESNTHWKPKPMY